MSDWTPTGWVPCTTDPRAWDDDAGRALNRQAAAVCAGCAQRVSCRADADADRTASGVRGGVLFLGGQPVDINSHRAVA